MQAEEIRGIIRTALENRNKTHDFIVVSVLDKLLAVDEHQTTEALTEEEPLESYDYPNNKEDDVMSAQNSSNICTLLVLLKFVNSAPLSVWSYFGAYPK